MTVQQVYILVLVLPLFSSMINGVFPKIVKKNDAGFIACILMVLTTLISLVIFKDCYDHDDDVDINIKNWISFDDINIYWSLFIDRLTALMMLTVTLISTVVHFYSLGYMKDDIHIQKFLSFLSLFTFFMLVLVSANNFLQLFLGWEGVGLCSYLLIGFWHYKKTANEAAIKAFITNRFGDFFFLIAIIMIFYYTKQLEFLKVFDNTTLLTTIKIPVFNFNLNVLDIICIFLFLGCMGKSAQIGLHTWLADAMEGPTPVSALIHAATMVTAGVFLIAKCSFLFEYSPIALKFITIIGGITCIFGASIAIAQTDIKRIIAYSTCSQLGYMFLACGVSAYKVGVFHLITHAFFKALLFLSAGNIIYTTHEQNILKLGGLREKLPLTYLNFCIGSLALIGIYPLAGFYSKDLILHAAYIAGPLGKIMFILGNIAVLFTAIYSIKIIMLVFHGNTNINQDNYNKIIEPPVIMNYPLSVLTIGSFFTGMIGYYILKIDKYSGYFLDSIFRLSVPEVPKADIYIELLPMFIGILGIALGFLLYKSFLGNFIKSRLGVLPQIINKGYYFDEIYNLMFVDGALKLGKIYNFIDRKVIDKAGASSATKLVSAIGNEVSTIQTGYIPHYILLTILGIITIMTYFIINYIKST